MRIEDLYFVLYKFVVVAAAAAVIITIIIIIIKFEDNCHKTN